MKKRVYKGTFAFKTDIGKVRLENEDQAIVLTSAEGEVLLVVCDGIGGQNNGNYASSIALSVLSEEFKAKRRYRFGIMERNWLIKAIRKANSAIYEEAQKSENSSGMGTTLVAALIVGESLYIANVGDSRAYAFSKLGLIRLTEDQTLVDYLAKTGRISEEEVSSSDDRHVLMNALGTFPSASVDISSRPYIGQALLLCSDGLYNNVPEEEIQAVLASDERADQKVSSLIAEANANGGSDNIGIAYWEARV